MGKNDKLKLNSIIRHFSLTCGIFVSGWWKFIIIFGVPYIVYVAIGALYEGMEASTVRLNSVYLYVILVFAGMVLFYIALAGLIYSLDRADSITVKEAFRKGVGSAYSLLWVTVIMAFIVILGLFPVMVAWTMSSRCDCASWIIGGTILGVSLGTLFLIWYGFAPFVLIHKGLRGSEALGESRKLVWGHWWSVFLRLIVFHVIFFLVQIQAMWILPASSPSILMVIIQPFLAIFMAIYMFVIFQDLDAIKHPKISSSSATPYTSSLSHPAGS